MRKIELVPFTGESNRIGGSTSCDSVVMRLEANDFFPQGAVVKWNRAEIPSVEYAKDVVEHLKASIALYEAVLGKKYIVPTQLVIGQKKDGDRKKIKVYTVQPYVSGWSGKTLPEDLRTDDRIIGQWSKLYSRLAIMYVIERSVNDRFVAEGKRPFPIELTVGMSRKYAVGGYSVDAPYKLPSTSNIVIAREDLSIKLYDFGKYVPWDDAMLEAYNEILQRSIQAVQSLP